MNDYVREYSDDVLNRRRNVILERRIRTLAMMGKSCAFAYIDAI